MIKLYYCRWNESDIDTVLQLSKNISDERLNRLKKYHQKEDKVRSILAELLLRYALREDDKNFEQPKVNKYGKPYINGIHFSVSHSGEMVVLGYSDSEIGVDIEPKQRDMEIDGSVFTPNEKKFIFSGGSGELQDRFVRMWTMKESLLKMVGTGIFADPDKYDIMEQETLFSAKLDNKGTKTNIISQKLEDDYYIAICSEYSEFDMIRCSVFELNEIYMNKTTTCYKNNCILKK